MAATKIEKETARIKQLTESEVKKGMGGQQTRFDNYVENQANDLLNEIKNNVSSYGEVKKVLRLYEQSVGWRNSQSNFLIVIAEAKKQLDEEIDAITFK